MLFLLILCYPQAWLCGWLDILTRSFLFLSSTFFGEEYKPAGCTLEIPAALLRLREREEIFRV